MFCSSCAAETDVRPCAECGDEPLLLGRYRYDARLGAGGSGITWRATRTDGLVVAIKDVPVPIGSGAREIALVAREVDVLRQLDHPAIPKLIEHAVEGRGRDRRVVVVLSYLDGETLAAESAHRRYTEADAAAVIADLTGILAYLHGLVPPVVHRDIKPGNVLRRPNGDLALVDFGSVRDFVPGTLTGGTVVGTFGYMAPEQFRGEATGASDFYAVGALAWWMLTRVEPRQQMTATGFAWRDRLRASPQVVWLLDGLLHPTSERRLADPAEVRRRLAGLAPGSLAAPATAQAKLAAVARPVPLPTLLTPAEPMVRFLAPPVPVVRPGERPPTPRALATLAHNGLLLPTIRLYQQREWVTSTEAAERVAAMMAEEQPPDVDLAQVTRVIRLGGASAAADRYVALTGESRRRAQDIIDALQQVTTEGEEVAPRHIASVAELAAASFSATMSWLRR